MLETGTETEVERHHLCRNLVWETSPDGKPVPGRYCSNRLGVVQLLDCPVFQGMECCLFDPRGEGEDPSPIEDEDLERIRTRLARDFLRWPYWRRVEVLRGTEAPPGEVEDFPDVIEVGAEAVEEAEETPVPETREEASAPPAPRLPPVDEALRERYPGQRRSEEERRSRRPDEEEAPLALDEGFVAGIFEETPEAGAAEPPPPEPPVAEPIVTEPPVAAPIVTEPPVAEPVVTEPPAAETPVTGPATEPAGKPGDEQKKKRRRRGGRPRRRRGRGKGKPKAE